MTDESPTEQPTQVEPLAGYRIGITAARRREEFGAALERRGAKVLYGPAIRIVPLGDDTLLRAATQRCIDEPLDFVVATTGIGFRGWIEAADTWGLADELTAAMGQAQILARGPKVRGAVRASGLREAWSPESESSSEVLDHLLGELDIDGKRIAVQLHGEPLPDMVDALRMAGADVIEVPVYRWVPPDDPAPLRRLVEAVAERALDAVAFTSAPAAASFLQAADDQGCADAVRDALRGGSVIAACVGPVTADPLLRHDIPVVAPARSRLGALVREIVEQVPHRLGRELPAAGHVVDLRGSAAVVDGVLMPLSVTSVELLRALTAQPGRVVPRQALLRLLPGEPTDEHAVEVAIGRLRTALGDARIVQTVVKRGYRFAYEPEHAESVAGSWRY